MTLARSVWIIYEGSAAGYPTIVAELHAVQPNAGHGRSAGGATTHEAEWPLALCGLGEELQRIDELSVREHLVMQVRAGRSARRTRRTR